MSRLGKIALNVFTVSVFIFQGTAYAEIAQIEEAQTVQAEAIPLPDEISDVAETDFSCNLNLEQAHRIALEQNPSLQAVAEKVEQTKTLVKQARSLYYPQVTASINALFQWLRDKDKEDADQVLEYLRGTIDDLNDVVKSLNGTVASRDLRRLRRSLRDGDQYLGDVQDDLDDVIEQYTYGVNAQYLVFDGFARKHTNAVARIGHEESQQGQLEARRLLLELVTQAFLGVQLARENLKVVDADKAFNARLLEDATAMLDYGKAPLSSVLNFEVAVKTADVRHISAEGDLRAAQLALARLMGLQDARWPEDWALCPLGEVEAPSLQLPPLDAQLNYALEHRPDLNQKELSVNRAESEIKRRKGAFYPQVGVLAGLQENFSYNQRPSFDSLSPQIGVGVSIDLFTGGRRKAMVSEAEHARREAEWLAYDTLLSVQFEVRDASLQLEVAQKRYLLLLDTVRVIQQTRNLVEEEYRAGKESLTRLNQSQRDLVQAEGQLALARVALRQAWFALDTATARSLEPFNAMTENNGITVETKVE